MAKSNHTEVMARIAVVESMLLDGKTSPEVVDYCAQTWGVSRATAYDYMGSARVRTARTLDDSGKREGLLGWCIHAYRFVYQRALEADQLGVAKATLDSLVDIFGLARPLKIAVKHEGNGSTTYHELKDAQLAAMIAAAQVAGQIHESTTPVEPEEREQPSPH